MRNGGGEQERRICFIYAFGALALWGVVLPVYLKALAGVPVLEILAHRVVWATLFAFVFLAALGRVGDLGRVRTPRTLGLLILSAALVTVNWVTYIAAVLAGHIVAASL